MKLLSTLLLSLISLSVIAQKDAQWVMAKYNHGIRLSGEKISEKDGIIKVKLITEDTIHVDRSKAYKIYDEENALVYYNGRYLETKGLFWAFSFGLNALSIFDSLDQRVSTHLEILMAKRLSKDLNVGAGVGFEFNEVEAGGLTFDTQFSSLYGYARYYLNDNRRRLFSFARLGYGFAAEENAEGIMGEHNGGFQSIFGLGLHFASRRSSRFQLMLGYYHQKTDGTEFGLDPLGNEFKFDFDVLIKRLILKFGWEFG